MKTAVHQAVLMNVEKMEFTTTFSERVLEALKVQKRNKTWLAEQIGISKQAMNYLLNHSMVPKYVPEISDLLNINPEWLKTGQGDMKISPSGSVKKIPIFPMDNIEGACINPEEYIVVSSSSCPDSCFAVALDSSSMEPVFSQNSVLVFDRSIKPGNTDYVLFRTKKNEIKFRQYFKDGNDIYLKPINPGYSSFDNEKVEILGVLIESRNHFR